MSVVATKQYSDSIEDALKVFDYQRWSVACREMQLRVINGALDHAKQVIDRFAMHQGYVRATLDSAVAAVFPVRVANSLEQHGYMTVRAVKRASDAQLAVVPYIGDTTIDQIRHTIAAIERGEILEQFEEDNELLDEACFFSAAASRVQLQWSKPIHEQYECARYTRFETRH